MTVSLRAATRNDIRDVAEVWLHAFPGERSLAERMHVLETGGVFDGIESVSVAEAGNRLAGAYKLYPLTQHIGGAALPMAGLAAVAVAPWARRRGVARVLCEHALRRARERSDVLSVLYPFRPDFYERLGWGTVGELHSFRFRPEHLRASGGHDVQLARDDDLGFVKDCYARAANRSNGLIDRPAQLWRRILAPDHIHVYVRRAPGGIDGYLLLRYGRSSIPSERTLFVRELIADSDDARDALLGWVSLQRDLWRVIRYDAAPDEFFTHRLLDPRLPRHRGTRWLWAPTARVIRGPMLRVLDIPRALEARTTWGDASPLTFELRVEDRELPDNAGPFLVDFDGATACVRPGSGAGVTLECDASGFARIYAGEIPASRAARLGLARVDGDARPLDRLFALSPAFRLLDEF